MGKIVAIGGGDLRKGETLLIDKRIIELSERKKPNMLFIPTAGSDSESYYKCFKKYFETNFNCVVDVLFLIREKPLKKEIQNKILSADIIYVGGGNTLKMMMIWRRLGVDEFLNQAYKKGTVLCGNSAGANCWFKYCSSDARKFTSGSDELIKVRCLDFVNALFCPHYSEEKNRVKSLKDLMKRTSGIGIGVDESCALEIIDGTYKVISNNETVNIYKVYWKYGKYYKEVVEKSEKHKSLKKLLKK